MSPSAQPKGPLYLDSDSAVERFLVSIAAAPVIALDTEGASFHRYVDRVYLLQISTEQHHAIIDPLRVDVPAGGLQGHRLRFTPSPAGAGDGGDF